MYYLKVGPFRQNIF